jgi:hypothetical protein
MDLSMSFGKEGGLALTWVAEKGRLERVGFGKKEKGSRF